MGAGLQRRRAMGLGGAQQHERDGEVEQRRDDRHREAEAELLDGPRVHQAIDGGVQRC